MAKFLFTSESVTEGHPDKICDRISDSVLDALLEQDPMSRVACETCTTTGLVMVMGEITTKSQIDIAQIARDVICGIREGGRCLRSADNLSGSVIESICAVRNDLDILV